jgi:[CysO sulfur-carrier protein]-S-L-cysteine hydrolase
VRGKLASPYPVPVLLIRRDLVEEVMAHARAEHPHEACGIIAGSEGGELPERVVRMVNAAKPADDGAIDPRRGEDLRRLRGEHDSFRGAQRTSTTEYAFDSAQWLSVTRELDADDQWPVVIYHSHTPRDATPSGYDVDAMTGPVSDPRTHYVIVSTWDGAVPTAVGHEFRSFRVVDGTVTEEQVEVVETYMFAHTGADDMPDQG